MVLLVFRGKYCCGIDIFVVIYVIDSLYLYCLLINESKIFDLYYYIEGNGENECYMKLIDESRFINVV